MTEEEIAMRVSDFFSQYECPKHYIGYNYLKSSLGCIMKLNGVAGSISKSVYVPVAEQYNADVGNIERCLRTLIAKWWESHRSMGLFETKPTPKQFLVAVSDKLWGDFCHDAVQEQRRTQRREELARMRAMLKVEAFLSAKKSVAEEVLEKVIQEMANKK